MNRLFWFVLGGVTTVLGAYVAKVVLDDAESESDFDYFGGSLEDEQESRHLETDSDGTAGRTAKNDDGVKACN